MNSGWATAGLLLTGIFTVAIVAVIFGSKNTSGVLQSGFGGLGTVIQAAVAPVASTSATGMN